MPDTSTLLLNLMIFSLKCSYIKKVILGDKEGQIIWDFLKVFI